MKTRFDAERFTNDFNTFLVCSANKTELIRHPVIFGQVRDGRSRKVKQEYLRWRGNAVYVDGSNPSSVIKGYHQLGVI